MERSLFDVPKKIWRTVYSTMRRLLIECASEVRDPHLVKSNSKLEDVHQRQDVRFICRLRGVESATARQMPGFDLFQDRHKNACLKTSDEQPIMHCPFLSRRQFD